MLKGIFIICFLKIFLPIYQYVSFFARHWKTFLVFVVEFVFKIHCLTEGPYRLLYVWCTEIRYTTTIRCTQSPRNLLCDWLSTFLLLNLFRFAIIKGLNTGLQVAWWVGVLDQ